MPAVTSWAGVPLSERRDRRRQQLLDATLELLGTRGGPAVTVRSVCRAARLTERYFYESFADRDALLSAAYQQVVAAARDALATAVAASAPTDRVRAAVEAFVALIIDDPRRGRVLLVEAMREPALTRQGAVALPDFAALVRRQLPPGPGRDAAAVATVGALVALFTAWLDGTLRLSRDHVVEQAVAVIVALTGAGRPGRRAAAPSSPDPAPRRRRTTA